MKHTFKVGDLLVWTETTWAEHTYRKNNPVKNFLYLMPPAGFFKIVDIDSEEGLTYYVQSLENPRWEKSLDELNLAKNFQLASVKYQEEAELILDLNDIGLL
jgi:hypothetical protein